MTGVSGFGSQQQFLYGRVQAGSASGTEVVTWGASDAAPSGLGSASGVSGTSGFTVENLTLEEVLKNVHRR